MRADALVGPFRLITFLLTAAAVSMRAEVVVVAGTAPPAVVVTADRPSRVAQYAARELVRHVELATGVLLRVAPESEAATGDGARLYLGNCRAARRAGIDVAKLAAEECVLRTLGGNLYVAGDDGGGDPLDVDTRAGTLWGVYEWLERELGARWLWPGDLGTVVPSKKRLIVAEVDETVPMRFMQRRLRPGQGFAPEHRALGFTEEAAKEFAARQAVFLRRHRMGRSHAFGYGHAFVDWWEKDGKARPEWFQLREGGARGPAKKGGRYSMCVSNNELQAEIVERWRARGGGERSPSFINACENDILGMCSCGACRAWDGPAPADHLAYYPAGSKMDGARFVSDRYARFWLGVQEKAAAVNPAATVVGYAYFNYFAAPTSGVRLNEHILIGFCPSAGWFPRSVEEHDWLKKQWTGWRATGASLFMRSNHLLDGYCMPFIFAHQFAEEFQHAAREGMVATDYDSLTGHWATQGPNLYVALRLHNLPETGADDLLAEYYAGFGTAGGAVKRYFDYWENFTTALTPKINKVVSENQASRWRTFARAVHVLYPAECFGPAANLLTEAEAAIQNDPQCKARVEFLRLGLKHAQLCARAAAKLSLASPEISGAEAKEVTDDVARFRRGVESSGIANFNHSAWVEDLSWRLPGDLKLPPELYP